MKVADEIGGPREDLAHGLTQALAHVMHTGRRGPVGLLKIPQKRNQKGGALTRDFDIGQDDLTQSVKPGHQGLAISSMQSIEVQHIAAGPSHVAPNPWSGLSMSNGKKGDELAAQIIDLGTTQGDTSFGQFPADLLGAAVTEKQGPANIDEDIIGDLAARLHDAHQTLCGKDLRAARAMPYGFMGDERPGKAENLFFSALQHPEGRLA